MDVNKHNGADLRTIRCIDIGHRVIGALKSLTYAHAKTRVYVQPHASHLPIFSPVFPPPLADHPVLQPPPGGVRGSHRLPSRRRHSELQVRFGESPADLPPWHVFPHLYLEARAEEIAWRPVLNFRNWRVLIDDHGLLIN